jgi:hypothetical protein
MSAKEFTMSDKATPAQRHKWLVRGALLFITLVIVAVIAVEIVDIADCRRRVQNAADSAALAGIQRLARHITNPSSTTESHIEATVHEYAGINLGAETTYRLTAGYLDAAGACLGPLEAGCPTTARGLQVSISIVAPTFLSRIAGLDGWPVGATTAAQIDVESKDRPLRFLPGNKIPP